MKGGLSEITAQLIDVPYKAGCMDLKSGLDCFSLVYTYLKMNGLVLPAEYGGLTLDNYYDEWRKDPSETLRAAIRFIEEYASRVEPHQATARDILLVANENESPFFAIDAGNGYMLTVIGDKVQSVNKKYYQTRMVFKCPRQ